MKFGSPLTMTGESVNQVDYLGAVNANGGLSVSSSLAAINAYNALLIVSGQTVRMYCAVGQNNSAVGAIPTFSAPAMQTASNAWQAMLPIVCKIGDILQVQAVFQSNMSSSGFAFQVYGLTGQCPVSSRSDGRTLPIGGLFSRQALVAATGPTTAISAPPSGLRIFLHSMVISAQNPAAAWNVVQLTGTIAGIAGIVLHEAVIWPGGSGQVSVSPPQGIVLDSGTAVNIVANAALTGAVDISYDLVL